MAKASKKSKKHSLDRRGFLKGAAVGAAASAATFAAPVQGGEVATPALPSVLPPTEEEIATETQAFSRSEAVDQYIIEKPGSDYMVDVLRTLDLEYCASNPGSSFEGLRESIVNYGDNRAPEFLTCLHEESAVAMAHGYAKIEGKPMMALLHGPIGLQHGSMAMYNAYVDRVPIYIVAGLDYDGPVPAHNAIDMAAMVRDFVKWDDQPSSLEDFARSAMRAYTIATTPPMAPVLLVSTAEIQKQPIDGNPSVPSFSMPKFPSADLGSVREIARLLVDAENPRINTSRSARTQHGIDLLVELAELIQAPVNDTGGFVNFPSRHPLAGTGTGQPDVILNLEVRSRGGQRTVEGVKTISITSTEFLVTRNYNVNSNGAGNADLLIAADAEATLPALIEEVAKIITDDRRRFFEERGAQVAAPIWNPENGRYRTPVSDGTRAR